MAKRSFTPKNPDFIAAVHESWKNQGFLKKIGAEIDRVEPGHVEISLPITDDLSQTHGYVSGSVVGALADVAGGYAAYTVTPADLTMLTAEYKINFINPAKGQRLIGRGYLVKPGSKLSISRAEVYALNDGVETQVAEALMTMITLPEVDLK